MKKLSHVFALPVLAALVWSSIAAAVPGPVRFRGCVRPGVEPGCLTVHSGQVIFNISAARPRPAMGRAIAGYGIRTGGVGFCPGVRLTNIHWRYIRLRCPPLHPRPYRR